jgi:hypothetical protein
MIYKTAGQRANSIEAKAVAAAMKHVTYDGVCGSEHPDTYNNHEHSPTLLNFPNSTEPWPSSRTSPPSGDRLAPGHSSHSCSIV